MDLNQPNTTSLANIKRSNHRSKTVARKKRSIRDYEFVYNENSKVKTSDLGAGAYGNVKRVREKATGQIFAMKIISKQNIFRYSNKENLRREISIQKSILHPHIIALKHYFEDAENVYIVLEYAENGTLFEYIRRKKKCSENESFIYFFQTALALDYLHKRNIIHRDLKPENLLLDKSGNVKVCDFGWSAEADNAKRQTFCGTIDYMAPEMIKNLPYDYHIDIWSLGVLLYELLHGKAPFRGRNDEEKCKNIAKNAEIAFDSTLSPEVCDLITKILKPNPLERLTMFEIFSHRWMKKYEIIYKIDIMSYVVQQDSSTGEVSLINDSNSDSPQGSLEDIETKRGEKREPSLERKAKSQTLGGERNIGFGIGKELNLKPSIGQTSTKESDENSRPGSGAVPSCSLDKEIMINSSKNRMLPFEFEHEKSKQFIQDSYRIANPLFMKQKGPHSDQERSRNKFLQTINTDRDFKRFKSTGREPINSLFGTTMRQGDQKKGGGYVYYNDNVEDEGRSLMSLYKKNQEIERRFRQLKHPQKEPGFFEKILMGIGCISRGNKTHVDV